MVIQKTLFIGNKSMFLIIFHIKILRGGFNAKLGREDIFKVTTGIKSLQQDSNDNGVRIVNFATPKKSSC